MQFEGNDIDKKLKEAADNHFPSYNDGAWKKMESLLDKHLPQRKEKRRILLFLLLFLLLGGGGAFLLISKPWNTSEPSGVTVQNDKQDDPLKSNRRDTEKVSENLSNRSQDSEDLISDPHSDKKPVLIHLDKKMYTDAAQKRINDRIKKIFKPSEFSIIKTDLEEDTRKDETKPIAGINAMIQEKEINNEEKKTEIKTNDVDLKDVQKEKPVGSIKNNKQKKNNSFFFSISAGPDISSVGHEFGRTKLSGGIGLGYTFNDRFTIRTGFYSARKIYSADKEYYKPDVTPPGYNYLQSVSADCKVFEVPLSLTYHFGRSEKQNFFASAGLSSYFMKKEVYDYLYKYPNNTTYTHRYSFENENDHYFSVAGISIGYQRKINKTFSIMAEPYLKIPLSGVGNGNVKLNSGGIIFSATVKPFQNTAKKKTTLTNKGQ